MSKTKKQKHTKVEKDAWSIDCSLTKWLISRLKQFLEDDKKIVDHKNDINNGTPDYIGIVKEALILLESIDDCEDNCWHDLKKGQSKLQQTLEKLIPIIHYLWT